jgi:antitoxin component YwqK of YwqJK toxin-antitoxin module
MNETQTETKAFKSMCHDLTGHGNYQFSVGETYEIDPKKEIKPGSSGFHACINLVDCIGYYDNDGSNRFFEVTIFGDYKVEGSKICGRKIRIDKEINLNEVLNGEFTNYYKMKQFYVNGKLHRDGDLPAVICPDGITEYYLNGQLHRDGDLPAIIDPCGSIFYYKNGLLHRGGDLPAITRSDGSQEYYINGQLHCDGDLPAVIDPDGTQEYYKNGKLHRDGDLPAVIYPDGTKEYFVNGKCYRGGDLPAIIDSDVMAVLSILQ